ncbi:hypothetical protein P154DRAFT_452270, partial [Amniculicola lignicola CBS 123094]
LKNKVALLKFITSIISIPIPKFLDLYKENGLLYLKTKYTISYTLKYLVSNTTTRYINKCIE